jgi:putative ABC transport system substrate-binding protein
MRDQTKAGPGVRMERRRLFSRVLRLLLVCLSLTLSLVSQGVHAEEVIVVSSRLNGPHSKAARVLETLLKEASHGDFRIRQMSVSDEEPFKIDAGPTDFILTIGTKAFADVVVQNTSTRLIALLIPEETYHVLLRANPRSEGKTSAVYIEQPVQRNLELVRVALPGRKPGILLGSQAGALEDQVNRVSKELNLPVYLKKLKPKENLVAALDQVLKNCNVLVAFADPEVSNPSTARHLLLTSYRFGIPVVAYSRAYVRAGALMAVYSSPEQFAQQAAEMLLHVVQNKSKLVPAPEYPRYFSVDINRNVARSLGINLKPRQEIESRLRSTGGTSNE